MNTKVKKWGNSLAIRLPKEVTSYLDISEDREISFEKKDGSFLLRAIKKDNKLSLEGIYKDFNINIKYDETDWGKSKGKEKW